MSFGPDSKTVTSEWPWVRTILTSGAPLDGADDVPGKVRFVPKPWAAMDVLVEAERAVRA